MDLPLLIKYLKFLLGRANDLLEKPEIEGYDIAVLQRELGDFQRSCRTGDLDMPALVESIGRLELKASDGDVGTDKIGFFRLAIKLLFGRGALGREMERKRQLATKSRIRIFRDELSHLLFEIDG